MDSRTHTNTPDLRLNDRQRWSNSDIYTHMSITQKKSAKQREREEDYIIDKNTSLTQTSILSLPRSSPENKNISKRCWLYMFFFFIFFFFVQNIFQQINKNLIYFFFDFKLKIIYAYANWSVKCGDTKYTQPHTHTLTIQFEFTIYMML